MYICMYVAKMGRPYEHCYHHILKHHNMVPNLRGALIVYCH